MGVAEHPENQPRLDASSQRVVQGYGILQPRVLSPLPAQAATSLWQWLFAGQQGLDPYSAMTSDVYQDFFSEGSFTGKLLPDGSLELVYSHDAGPSKGIGIARYVREAK